MDEYTCCMHFFAPLKCCHNYYMHAGALAYGGSRYGPGIGPVYLNGLECTGNESHLAACSRSYYGYVSPHCRSHFEDASVVCPTSMCNVSHFTTHLWFLSLLLQFVLMTNSCVMMVELMVNSHHVLLLINDVIISLTVLEEKMKWSTTVSVDLKEQSV